jgi:serine phosphatase RsbU (regulator of sigma subunit)
MSFKPHADSPSARAPDAPSRILIVDDDPAALRLLGLGLESAGFAVETAGSGEAALAAIAQRAPDAVVLDFEMPGLNGVEVCAQIRAAEALQVKELPVIMLTAHVGESDELRCLEAGANDFVTKPVSRAVLQARIQMHLRLRAYARQLEEWRTIQEADLASARATQQAMLPQASPTIPGWEVQARYTPLIQVGGDMYGWERLNDGRWLFWMADGTGHGAAAALVTALTAHLFSQAAETSDSPSEILVTVNREFLRVVGGSTFMTACCAVLNTDGELTFSSAGHPPILIVRKTGEVESHWPQKTILGLKHGLTLGDGRASLAEGDVALLYTDGLYSLRTDDHQRLGHDVVERVARESAFGESIVDDLIARVQRCSDGAPVDDDLAVIALRRMV